jgi:hypothetical protein
VSAARPPVEVRDGDELTQFVTKDLLRDRPHSEEQELSMLLGMLSPMAAVTCIIRKRSSVVPTDGVRYTTAGALRSAGFEVASTPEKGNPLHVSVRCPQDWDDDVAQVFSSCLGAPIWEGGDGV